jgi:hypothetical protein
MSNHPNKIFKLRGDIKLPNNSPRRGIHIRHIKKGTKSRFHRKATIRSTSPNLDAGF